MTKRTITLLGTNHLVNKQSLIEYVYKSLPLRLKLNRKVNREHIQEHLTVHGLIYHPFWVAKTLVIADRKPFPPKKSPNMIFIDGVSHYRGLFANIPELTDVTVNKRQNIIQADLTKNEVIKYIKDVQFSQINRTYLLKKPDHEIVDYFITYLPLWTGKVDSPYWQEHLYINANTGELETHLSKLWLNKEKISL